MLAIMTMRDGIGITREDVIWCYETFLQRAPESEEVVQYYLSNFITKKTLIWVFLNSEEFRRRNVVPAQVEVPRPAINDFSYSDRPEVQREILKLLRHLEPHKAEGLKKVRIGADGDGGYVMLDDFAGIVAAYSLGIANDVSWDLDIANRGIDVFQYDHTIDKLPAKHPRFKWVKRGVAAFPNKDLEILPELIRQNGHSRNDDLLLKCDVEGGEWKVMASIDAASLRQFRQIVIEMHGFQILDRETFLDTAKRAIPALTRFHKVVHVHANNNSAYAIVGAIPLPAVLELTLVRHDRAKLVRSDEVFPTKLDKPCASHRADYCLGSFRFSGY
jgi:hypothetical protein